jgi:hypothetical protein
VAICTGSLITARLACERCDDAKSIQMCLPHLPVNEARLASLGKTRHHRGRQAAAVHVVKRRLVQHEVGVAGPQQVEKVQPAL